MPTLLAFDSRERLDGICSGAAGGDRAARHPAHGGGVGGAAGAGAGGVAAGAAEGGGSGIVRGGRSDCASSCRSGSIRGSYRLDVRAGAAAARLCQPKMRAGGRWLLLLLSHHLAVDHTTLEVAGRGDPGSILRGGQRELPAPLPFRNFVAQARLGVSRAEHEAFFRADAVGDVRSRRRRSGCWMCRGTGWHIEEATRAGRSGSWRERLRAHARALGVSAASCVTWPGRRCWRGLAGARMWCSARCCWAHARRGRCGRVLGMFINTLPVRIRVGRAKRGGAACARRMPVADANCCGTSTPRWRWRSAAAGWRRHAPLFTALLNYRHSERGASSQRRGSGMGRGCGVLAGGGAHQLSVDAVGGRSGGGFRADGAGAVHRLSAQRVCGYHAARAGGAGGGAGEDAGDGTAAVSMCCPRRSASRCWWSGTRPRRAYPRSKCMHELFEEQVERTPDAVAVVYEDEQLSYAELNERANQLAHYLRELGVRPDERVGICVERSWRWWWDCWRS